MSISLANLLLGTFPHFSLQNLYQAQVWALAGPPKDIHWAVLKTLISYAGWALRVPDPSLGSRGHHHLCTLLDSSFRLPALQLRNIPTEPRVIVGILLAKWWAVELCDLTKYMQGKDPTRLQRKQSSNPLPASALVTVRRKNSGPVGMRRQSHLVQP